MKSREELLQEAVELTSKYPEGLKRRMLQFVNTEIGNLHDRIDQMLIKPATPEEQASLLQDTMTINAISDLALKIKL